jgi:hypothetical protein
MIVFKRTSKLKPFLKSEIDQHANGQYKHDSPYKWIAVGPFQFRKVLEIHAVHPYNKGKRNENGRNDGEYLDDLVQLVVLRVDVDIHQA